MSAGDSPLLGGPASDRACRRWISGAISELSRVDDGRALAVGAGAASFIAPLRRRYEYVLVVGSTAGELTVVAGGRRGAGAWPTVRVERRELLEVEPEIDGRFDLILAVDVIRRLNADDLVLPHLGWLLAPAGRLLAVDAVSADAWAAVRRTCRRLLPGSRIDPVQLEVMGLRWQRRPAPGSMRLVVNDR
jgi:SAM-dependent methyltransferase